MDQPDPIIHQPVRLRIMAALKALPPASLLEFARLKTLVGATDGNLGAHITSLEEAGYVEVRKDFHANRPRTRAGLTKPGLRAFEAYVQFLRSIIDLETPL